VKIACVTDQRDTVEGTDPQDLVVNLYRKYNKIGASEPVDIGKVISWVADVSQRANLQAAAREATVIYHHAPPIAWLTDMLGAGLLHSLSYQTTGEARMKPSTGIWC
jgi:hypothetical protein